MSRIQERSYIPADWKKWIAENLARGSVLSDLQTILEQQGYAPELVRAELETAMRHPYLEAARSLARQMAKRDWLLHTHRQLRETGRPFVVERRERISSDEFLQHYYSENRPVVLTKCFDHWPACVKWDANFLKSIAGHLDVEIQANRTTNAKFEEQPELHRKSLRFTEFVDKCFEGSVTNDFYLTARNGNSNHAIMDLLHRDMGDIPEYLDASRAANSYFLWFGPPGTITPLHHDMTNNFMAQVVGKKLVRMIAPDYHPFIYNTFHCYSEINLDQPDLSKYPLFRDVAIHDVEIGPGDLLFLPIGWWHYVRGLSTSMTLTCTNFRWPNDFRSHYSTHGLI